VVGLESWEVATRGGPCNAFQAVEKGARVNAVLLSVWKVRQQFEEALRAQSVLGKARAQVGVTQQVCSRVME